MWETAVLGGNTQVVQLKIAGIEIVENGFWPGPESLHQLCFCVCPIDNYIFV